MMSEPKPAKFVAHSKAELLEILDQLAPEDALDAWLPIATAPGDGTQILIGRPELEDNIEVSTLGWWMDADEDGPDCMGHDAGFVDHEFQCFGPGRSFGAESHRHTGTQPTHWQPLPAPPTVAINAKE